MTVLKTLANVGSPDFAANAAHNGALAADLKPLRKLATAAKAALVSHTGGALATT